MRVLTHNVYWFQGSPSRWGEERVAGVETVFDALCELYAEQAVDVICLQEIREESRARSLSGRLGMSEWIFFRGGTREDYGGAILARSPAQLADHTRDGKRSLHERCHARATKSSVEIAAVHLPSDRYCNDAEAGERARVTELDRIISTGPAPDVVLGDFNSPPGSAPSRRMQEMGYIDAAVQTGADKLPSFRKSRVDCIWLTPPLADRLVRFETLEHGPFVRKEPDGKTWRLSDHPPLIVELAL